MRRGRHSGNGDERGAADDSVDEPLFPGGLHVSCSKDKGGQGGGEEKSSGGVDAVERGSGRRAVDRDSAACQGRRRDLGSRRRRQGMRPRNPAFGTRADDLKTYDPKTIGPDEYVGQMTAFLERHYLATIHSTIVSAEDQEKDYALAVNAQDLIHFDSRLGYLVLRRPDLLLELMCEALGEVQTRIVAEAEEDGGVLIPNAEPPSHTVGQPMLQRAGVRPTLKTNARIRITHLPPVSDLCKPNISSIRGNDLGALIQIQGTVIRTAAVKMLEVSREYRCQNKTCGAIFSVHSDMSQGNLLSQPTSCPGVGEKQCKSTRFVEHGDHRYSDYQEVRSMPYTVTLRVGVEYATVKVQEQAQKLSVGSIPRSMVVLLQDDLVDSCKAGDDVVIVGELLRRWKPVFEGVRCDVQVTLKANSVIVQSGLDQGTSQVSEELRQEFVDLWKANAHRPLAVRNHIVASVCPQIFGLFTVKLAILLTLIGGVTETDPRGMRRRGTPHLLVVGDPGCGKSQFLRFAAKLSPRSVLTTGVGTTSAGLTCSAVKDGGEWMLEAGALVLADRGLCCIDEFSAIREHDRATIHEAMEQQTLSVAKAGLVCKLNARTTVFAVTNTKGAYDTSEDMTVNTAIGSPLLSRFDLVLLLLDTKNKHWDKVVSTFVLRAAIGPSAPQLPPSKKKKLALAAAGGSTRDCAKEGNGAVAGEGEREDGPVSSKPWGTEKLQKYLCYVRDTFTSVRLTGDAEKVVSKYYRAQRSADNRSAARTTVRLLESLIRLAQAHARLMCRTEVTLQDAVVSVICVETSLHSTAKLGMDSVLHSDFPPNPDGEFQIQQGLILDRLGLSHLHRPRQPTSPHHASWGGLGGADGVSEASRSPAGSCSGGAGGSNVQAVPGRRQWAAREAESLRRSRGTFPRAGTGADTRHSQLPRTQPMISHHRRRGGGDDNSTGSPTEGGVYATIADSETRRGGGKGDAASGATVANAHASLFGNTPAGGDDTMRVTGTQMKILGVHSGVGSRDAREQRVEGDREGGGGGGGEEAFGTRSQGASEGGKRWQGFDSIHGSASKGRRRKSLEGEGSGWGDVLFMSQRPITPPPAAPAPASSPSHPA